MGSLRKPGTFLCGLFLWAYDAAMLFAAFAYTLFRGIFKLGLWRNRDFYFERLGCLGRLEIDKNNKSEGDKPRVIWLHAVSVGEVAAAKSLIRELRKQEPTATIVITTITDTGRAEALKITELDYVFAHPFDYSYAARKFVKRIKPDILILVEGDFWLQHMRAVAASGRVPIYIVNGKISEPSLKQYKRFPGYAALIFDCVTHIYAQAGIYAQRFKEVGVDSERISVDGNIKLDNQVVTWSARDLAEFKCKVGFENGNAGNYDRIITFGSSHPGENEIFISVMRRLLDEFADTGFFLVPRHPDRANNIRGIFDKYGITYKYYSELQNRGTVESDNEGDSVGLGRGLQAVCVDAIGYLDRLYRITDIAVVGGTFVEVGGHNILEPGRYAVPVIYGPHIFKQPGLHEMVKEAGAGVQVNDAEGLYKALSAYMKDVETAHKAGLAGRAINDNAAGLSSRIIASILTGISGRS